MRGFQCGGCRNLLYYDAAARDSRRRIHALRNLYASRVSGGRQPCVFTVRFGADAIRCVLCQKNPRKDIQQISINPKSRKV
ncbi:MAG: hypothetical protein II709_01090 [Ruminococcus sp.]|nr:hypothetical protein [Ruminococcus sp.]